MPKTVLYNIQFDYQTMPDSGSSARPRRMRAAFEADGFEVLEMSGSRSARAQRLSEVLALLPDLDPTTTLLYAESATFPHVFDQNTHLPATSPDIALAKAAGSFGIPTALFYRDMHWAYLKPQSLKSKLIALFYKPAYTSELKQYAATYRRLYAPTQQLMDRKKHLLAGKTVHALPPGSPTLPLATENKRSGAIHVGGITTETGLYDLKPVIAACTQAGMDLHLVCRPGDWEQAQKSYPNGDYQVSHLQGADKDPALASAQLGLLYYPAHAYRDVAFPFKLLEYLAAGLPIVCSAPSAAADFVTANNVGWAVTRDQELHALLQALENQPELIDAKRTAIPAVLKVHTWAERIAQLKRDLWGQ